MLVRFSGSDAEELETTIMGFYQQALDRGLLGEAIISQSLAQEENLWHLRDEIPPEGLFNGKPIKWDVSVPVSRVCDFITAAQDLVQSLHPDGQFYAFGHVGDGNIHTVAFPGNDGEPDFKEACADLYARMDKLVWSFNGSICAEHGVGIENAKRLQGQKSDVEMDMMRRIKQLFDPDNRMNPGKLIAD